MRVTSSNVLRIIADERTLKLFISIARNNKISSKKLMNVSALTGKQYYSRTNKMLKAGVIKRKNGCFSLTAFGAVIYETCVYIGDALMEHTKRKERENDILDHLEL
jgi:predicted transcriptional regulator